MNNLKIALRYCGGCNSRYDRGAFVRRLEAAFPSVTLRPYAPQEPFDAVLIICGCLSQCAQQKDLPENIPRFVAALPADYDRAAAFLNALCTSTFEQRSEQYGLA
nr:hypothetical protein [uncultured Oscillibacter sp.]